MDTLLENLIQCSLRLGIAKRITIVFSQGCYLIAGRFKYSINNITGSHKDFASKPSSLCDGFNGSDIHCKRIGT